MRNEPEQLTASHIPWALKPIRKNLDLRICDVLFVEAHPKARDEDSLQNLIPDSLKEMTANEGPSLAVAQISQKFQFEHFWNFVMPALTIWSEGGQCSSR